jgi:hypothetical protein
MLMVTVTVLVLSRSEWVDGFDSRHRRGEVILGLGALLELKKFWILIEFELWRCGRKMGLWGLRRGEPVRKVEGEIEVKTMEDGGRRKERGVGEREMDA